MPPFHTDCGIRLMQVVAPQIGLTEEDWKEVGAYANSLVQNDMAEGVFQTPTGTSNKPNYNQQYAKYKANGMKRFTVGKEGYFYGKTYFKNKKAKKKSERLSGYYGISTNRQVGFVNMILTGTLQKALKYVKPFSNGVTCGFEQSDNLIGKLKGANRYNRLLLGLSDKNIAKVKTLIESLLKAKNIYQVVNIEVKF